MGCSVGCSVDHLVNGEGGVDSYSFSIVVTLIGNATDVTRLIKKIQIYEFLL